jgi:Spy/CpxP family protein refolding chaperone
MIRVQSEEATMYWIRAWVLVLAMVTGSIAAIAQTAPPYAGQEWRALKALSDQEIEDLLEARGMGVAKVAELNSYPGPLHVLQLADQLGLSEAQRVSSRALYERMRENALAVGRKIIDAERVLDQAFSSGIIDPATLRSHVSAIAVLQGQLRTIHLEAHLAQRGLLTPEQISQYDVLRGYDLSRPIHHGHRYGG